MRWRWLYVVAGAAAAALLAAWAAGSLGHSDCEHSCPARGGCPVPAACLHHPFNWSAAVVVAIIVAIGSTCVAWVAI